MEQEINIGQMPEQKLNTNSEIDPKSVVTVVYRGPNEFMSKTVKDLHREGFKVVKREVPSTLYEQVKSQAKSSVGELDYDDNLPWDEKIRLRDEYWATFAKAISPIIPQLHGVVLSDNTLESATKFILGYEPILPEEVLKERWSSREDVVKNIEPIIKQIKEKGRLPVVQEWSLGDHISACTDLGVGYKEGQKYYVDILREEFGLESVRSGLDYQDDSKNVVWLCDHHSRPGKDVDFVLICPCHANLLNDDNLYLATSTFPIKLDQHAAQSFIGEKLASRINQARDDEKIVYNPLSQESLYIDKQEVEEQPTIVQELQIETQKEDSSAPILVAVPQQVRKNWLSRLFGRK